MVCGVHVSDGALPLSALSIDAARSAVVAGATRRCAPRGALEARVRAVAAFRRRSARLGALRLW